MAADESNEIPPARYESSTAWSFAVLAVIVVIILVGWGWSGHGRGWGSNEIAHMTPPGDAGMHGPATRSWMRANGH